MTMNAQVGRQECNDREDSEPCVFKNKVFCKISLSLSLSLPCNHCGAQHFLISYISMLGRLLSASNIIPSFLSCLQSSTEQALPGFPYDQCKYITCALEQFVTMQAQSRSYYRYDFMPFPPSGHLCPRPRPLKLDSSSRIA